MSYRTFLGLLCAFGTLGNVVLPAAEPAGELKSGLPDGAEARLKVMAVLQQPIDIKLEAVPLEEAARQLSKENGISIQFDRPFLADAGISVELPVTFTGNRLSLQEVLNRLLTPHGLTWLLHDEVVLITTPEGGEYRLYTRVYPVTDLMAGFAVPQVLIAWPGAIAESSAEEAALIDLIHSVLTPSSWEEVGGPGSLRVFRGRLVVSQTQPVHKELEQFLIALRRVPRFDPTVELKLVAPIALHPPTAVQTRLIKQLEQLGAHEFENTPLDEVVATLRKTYDLDLQIDDKALDDVGIAPQTRITFHGKNISLGTALGLMLRELDLVFFTHEGRVLITTPVTDCRDALKTIIYPVGDLLTLPADATNRDVAEALGQLRDTIQATLQPNRWDEVGGPSTIDVLAGWGSLVCSCPEDLHKELAELLEQLRKTQPPAAEIQSAPAPLMTHVFLLPLPSLEKNKPSQPTPTPAELEVALRQFVAPDAWAAPGAMLQVLPGRVIVRQRAEVIAAVQQFLADLALQQPADGDMRRGGGFFNLPTGSERTQLLSVPVTLDSTHGGP